MGTILCDNSFQDNQWLPYQSMHSPPSLSSQTPHSHGWLSVRWPRPASWPWSLSSSTSSANLEGKRKWTTFWPVSTALSNSACVHTPSTNVFSVSAITWNQCFVHRMHVMLCSITTTSCLEVSTPFRGIHVFTLVAAFTYCDVTVLRLLTLDWKLLMDYFCYFWYCICYWGDYHWRSSITLYGQIEGFCKNNHNLHKHVHKIQLYMMTLHVFVLIFSNSL